MPINIYTLCSLFEVVDIPLELIAIDPDKIKFCHQQPHINRPLSRLKSRHQSVTYYSFTTLQYTRYFFSLDTSYTCMEFYT